MATLYGHLQCRARDGVVSRLGCRQLATAWHLHPRELRADLQDLAAIGWLTVTSSSALGLTIQLHEPEAMAEPAAAASPEASPEAVVVAVEPDSSPVITQTLAGEEPQPGPHRIQGIGAGFVPGNLDVNLIDQVERVSDSDAIAMAQRLMREEGILSGISCGAAATVAVRLAQEDRFAGQTIVVVLPDSGERYLSTALFENVFDAQGLPVGARP